MTMRNEEFENYLRKQLKICPKIYNTSLEKRERIIADIINKVEGIKKQVWNDATNEVAERQLAEQREKFKEIVEEARIVELQGDDKYIMAVCDVILEELEKF